ncbi:hypothetical protein GCM10012280_26140 [Wenjunlia tyrosinilytica]|uniref:Alpha-N-acetylglucosaminidase n=1 Tax=Wenjunlia tyrosinilytica TaxID=1544741 RepID=A0A917ZQL8_9ACTN|nr:hypothetical protein GCM10012280_26140 [Wenjunlia tyrosinilytica]
MLGAAAALGAVSTLTPHSPAAAAAPFDPARTLGPAPTFDPSPAHEALVRLLGRHAGQFHLVPTAPAAGQDRFRVEGSAGRIEVHATTPATLLAGVHWYLKDVCDTGITWSGSRLDLPERLPAPGSPIEHTAAVRHRFVLNDTNDGYTAPYADWAFWERLIDVLALHGCNEVLVTTGQEAVYHRVLQDFGYTEAEARSWIPAPSHQPWWLLQNLSAYGGPIGRELLDTRTRLGVRIVERLRALGMAPVLPGWFGTVPDGFVRRNPGARAVPQGTWHGFARPDWLDPRTSAFRDVATSFYGHQRELFGAAAHFKMDLLHEGGTPGDVPVPDAARAVESALRTAHPEATWVILGWQDNPRRDLLDAVDKERMLVVDGVCDRFRAVTDRERDWGGTPYAFGSIPNYGGRTTIGAKARIWIEKFFTWRDKAGSALVGTAYMPESALRDPAAFELFSELAWRERPVDLPSWFDRYARLRYGGPDESARAAWSALRESAYGHVANERADTHDSLFAARPTLAAHSAAEYAPHALAYDPAVFDRALAGLLRVDGPLRRSTAYRYDLVDVARQAVANRGWRLLPQLRAAYERADADTFRALSSLWLRLMRLSDDITGTDPAFMLGPWLEAARRAAADAAEAAELERTARVLLTTWGGRATSDAGNLHEYADRDWSGLTRDFYLPRWRRYLDGLADALASGRPPEPVDWYAVEEPWTRERKEYPQRPTADAFRTARRVREVLARAPYQGTLSVTAVPPALSPGGTAEVTAVLANGNGLSPTGRADFELTGLDAQPQGPTWVPRVPAGGRASVAWRTTAPDAPLTRPLEPLPYVLSARYGPRGQARVRAVHPGNLYVAGPLGPDLRTATTNAAVFGRSGDRFGIEGAGDDLWKGVAQFGAVFREAAMAYAARVTTRVDSQTATGPWARAGIVVRDSLAAEDAPGFVCLAVTPGNGVVLSFDSNGDGTLDTYRKVAGLGAPVGLRLTREGALFTGEYSTDGGTTWQAVATVTVPGAQGARDAGLFMSASNGGSGARGLVEFTGFELDPRR